MLLTNESTGLGPQSEDDTRYRRSIRVHESKMMQSTESVFAHKRMLAVLWSWPPSRSHRALSWHFNQDALPCFKRHALVKEPVR